MVRELQSRWKGKVSAVPDFSKDKRETTNGYRSEKNWLTPAKRSVEMVRRNLSRVGRVRRITREEGRSRERTKGGSG
jgi:hypothetical protein